MATTYPKQYAWHTARMATPWGTSDRRVELAPHVWDVSTPSHGGIMVAKATAAKLLSQAALDAIEAKNYIYGGYYCFEEDCDWAIFAYEQPDLFALTFDGMLKTAEQVRQDAKECLERWNTEYLTARETFPCQLPSDLGDGELLTCIDLGADGEWLDALIAELDRRTTPHGRVLAPIAGGSGEDEQTCAFSRIFTIDGAQHYAGCGNAATYSARHKIDGDVLGCCDLCADRAKRRGYTLSPLPVSA